MTDDVRLVLCETCGSEGRLYYDGGVRLMWYGLEPVEIDGGECPECEGSGQLLVEVFPIELEDLDIRGGYT